MISSLRAWTFFLFGLHLIQQGVEPLEAALPELAVALQPPGSLCKRLGVSPACPDEMLGSMATLPLPAQFQGVPKTGKIDPDQMRLYDEFRIEVPFNRFGQRGSGRVSRRTTRRLDSTRTP